MLKNIIKISQLGFLLIFMLIFNISKIKVLGDNKYCVEDKHHLTM